MNPPSPDNAPIEILIAEDSPTQLLQLRHVLETHGMSVTPALNGKEALALMEKRPPTMLITDIQMPEMDGYELCRRIKAHPLMANIPVILLTSLSDVRDIVSGLECGADNFIVKPYDEEFLMSRIHHILENQRLSREEPNANGIPFMFAGVRRVLPSHPSRMIGLLVSTYETAVQKNLALRDANAALEEKARELARSNADLERFGYIASHDLIEPLRTITNFLQLLERRYQSVLDNDAKEYIVFAVDGATRMRRLITALLEYSRVGTRAHPLSLCDCNKILATALQNLQVAIEESAAQVTHEVLPTVMADEIQLEQLLQNLIGNALKFHKPGEPPRIHIGVKRNGSDWQFSVQDHGIGIPEKESERIFEIFQRLHTVKEYAGTGIGLAICKKIVERHGGRIWVTSQPGAGSTFSFTIPAADGHVAQPQPC